MGAAAIEIEMGRQAGPRAPAAGRRTAIQRRLARRFIGREPRPRFMRDARAPAQGTRLYLQYTEFIAFSGFGHGGALEFGVKENGGDVPVLASSPYVRGVLVRRVVWPEA